MSGRSRALAVPLPHASRPPRADPTVGGRARLGLAGLAVVTAALHSLVGLQRYRSFRLGTYDQVIFDQAVRGYARLGPPVSPAKGIHNGFGPHFSVLGDHFSPVLALLAPTYWLRPDPATLLVAQGVFFALAVPPVWVLARRQLGQRAAWPLAAAFALSWPLAVADGVGFHEVAFAVPITAWALERWSAGRLGQCAAIAALLLLVKEDMGLVLAVLGVLILVRSRGRGRLLGVVLLVGGLAAVALTTLVLLPAAGGRRGYYWYYGSLGATPGAAAAYVLHHPLATLHQALTPAVKWQTLVLTGLPVLFACLASPLVLLAVPLLAERLLSDNPNHWGSDHHYDALLVAIVFAAGIEGVARLRDRRGTARLVPAWAVAVAATAAVLAAGSPLRELLDPAAWRTTARVQAAAAAVAAVPDGVTVEADNDLGPHLTSRTTVLLLDTVPRSAPWVVADVSELSFPFASLAQQQERVALLRQRGYRIVSDRGGYVVLHRGAGAA